jgi:FkbM family methyltransferase
MPSDSPNALPAPPLLMRILAKVLRRCRIFPRRHWLERYVESSTRGRGYEADVRLHSGVRMILPLDDWVCSRIFLTGEYDLERQHARLMLAAIKPWNVVLDIGGHVGYYTLQFARKVGPSGHVHTFEPMSRTFFRLKRNVLANALNNVTLNQCAVRAESGPLTVYYFGEDNIGASSVTALREGSKAETVPAITIDEYLREHGCSRIDVVKIDVEGSEMAVLHGMTRTLQDVDAPDLFVELNFATFARHGLEPADIVRFLKDCGYRAYRLSGNQWQRSDEMGDEALAWFTKRPTITNGSHHDR